jgi:heterodisulfide reductase subunit C
MPRERSRDLNEKLAEKVDAYKLVPKLSECLACGKCAGICPVAALNPSYNPRQIIRDVLSGNEERWISSEEIWRCFWCAGCYTVCPADIPFPLLIMQLRYRAIERGYGLKYIAPFKRFALRAREDALTFAPGAKGRERIKKIRSSIGEEPWPAVSDKARSEYCELFEMTGTNRWLEEIKEEDEKPVTLKYVDGRIVSE